MLNPEEGLRAFYDLRATEEPDMDPEAALRFLKNLLALVGLRIERRLGTSVRIPKTLRLLSTDSVMARSRIYFMRPAERVVFAGREL